MVSGLILDWWRHLAAEQLSYLCETSDKCAAQDFKKVIFQIILFLGF